MTRATYQDLAGQVPQAGENYDWSALCSLVPELLELERTPQDPYFHAEGNVGIHTRMVLDALLEDAHYRNAAPARRFVLFYAALLHDVTKPRTTVVDLDTGRVSQPGHSRKGAIDARVILWHAGVPFALRESICRIIAVHQVPFFAFGPRAGQSPERIVRNLSWVLPLPDLTAVARADMRGRAFEGREDCLADIDLFETLAQEENCWLAPRFVASAHTRLAYARGAEIHLDTPLYQEAGSKVIVLSGLPAAGKDTWVSRHGAGLPVVSFDDAKSELGLRHGENDGQAAHHATDKARVLLRQKAPFIWNATHLSKQMRDKTLDLLVAYHAEIRLVYLEASPETIFVRNSARDTSLRNADIVRMLHRWEVPVPTEAHHVDYPEEAREFGA